MENEGRESRYTSSWWKGVNIITNTLYEILKELIKISFSLKGKFDRLVFYCSIQMPRFLKYQPFKITMMLKEKCT